jgi:hypothetical protein
VGGSNRELAESKRDAPGGSNRVELSNREESKRGGEDELVPGDDVRIDSSDWGRPDGESMRSPEDDVEPESIRGMPAAEGSPDGDSRLDERVLIGWEWDIKLGGLGLCSPGRPCPSDDWPRF